MAQLTELKELKHIVVSGRHLTAKGLRYLQALPNIEYINFPGQNLTVADAAIFDKWRQMSKFSLPGAPPQLDALIEQRYPATRMN